MKTAVPPTLGLQNACASNDLDHPLRHDQEIPLNQKMLNRILSLLVLLFVSFSLILKFSEKMRLAAGADLFSFSSQMCTTLSFSGFIAASWITPDDHCSIAQLADDAKTSITYSAASCHC